MSGQWSVVEQTRAVAMAKIDRLQRQIAFAHRRALADILDLGIRAMAMQGGVGHLSSVAVRKRLDQLRIDTVALIQPVMTDMVAMGSQTVRAVMEAALKGRATKRNRESNDMTSFSANFDDDTPPELALGLSPSPKQPVAQADFPDWILPPLSREETLALLHSRNGEGMTWEEQLDRSSHRVADPQAMADALSQGISSGEGILQLRERIKPLVENLSVSAQRIARTESYRVLNTTQNAEYERADKILAPAGLGIKGMTMHCAMMPTSAPDHMARNGKYYVKASAGRYVADDGEVLQTPPYGHPNCSCYTTPKFVTV